MPAGWPGWRRAGTKSSSGKVRLFPPVRPTHYSTMVAARRKLTRIIGNLEPLSKEHGLVKFLKNADRVNTLNGFVQDLLYAITDYQVCVENPPLRIV